MNLRTIGYYKEMPQGKDTDPSIYDAVGKGDALLIEKICKYLDNGTVLVVSPGVTTDIIEDTDWAVGTGSACTDGRWLWPDDLSYYVRKYNIALPKAFLDTMHDNEWENPGKNLTIGNDNIMINGIEI